MICGANQWTNLYMIESYVMKELNSLKFQAIFRNDYFYDIQMRIFKMVIFLKEIL